MMKEPLEQTPDTVKDIPVEDVATAEETSAEAVEAPAAEATTETVEVPEVPAIEVAEEAAAEEEEETVAEEAVEETASEEAPAETEAPAPKKPVGAEFEYNARPLGVKEDGPITKFIKNKILKSTWFEYVSIGFVILVYLLPVILMAYVLTYFFNR